MHEASTLNRVLTEIQVISQRLTASPDLDFDLARLKDLNKAARKLRQAIRSAEELLAGEPPGEVVIEAAPREEKTSIRPVEQEPVTAVVVAMPARKAPKPEPPPVPVVEPTTPPEPKVEAKPKGPSPQVVRRFETRLRELVKRTDQLLDPTTPRTKFALKALVAGGRALRERAATEVFDLSGIEPELEKIIDLYHADDDSEYFGVNLSRRHSAEIWEDIDLAYQALDAADAALITLESFGEARNEAPEALIQDLAACVQFLFHVVSFHGLNVTDRVARPLIDHLRELYPDIYMGALMIQGPNALPLSDVREMASRFIRDFPAWLEKRKAATQRAAARDSLARLMDLIGKTDNPEGYLDDMREATRICLEAGIPASNKELVGALLPYRAFFENETQGKMKALRESLAKSYMTLSVKGTLSDPLEPVSTNPEQEKWIEGLRPLLEDKVLLLVGGNKGQGWRKDELAKALGLKEVLWPDLEDGSNFNSVRPDVQRADVVAQLIRWSRHGYSELMTFAKECGKPVVRVTSGLGTNRIIHDLYMQLIGDRKE